MINSIHRFVDHLWYGKSCWVVPLLPLSWLYGAVTTILRWGMPQTRFSKPIIIIGNLTVGGTGKTPVTIHLVDLLKKKGIRPGIVSRGYGARCKTYPHTVREGDDPTQIGDEVFMLYEKTRCPTVIAPSRLQAVKVLLAHPEVDVILSDDGMQHFFLPRQEEILIIDGERQFGNGFLLPAGPLRESKQAMDNATAILVKGGVSGNFCLQPEALINMRTGEKRHWHCFAGQEVHVCAGIGNPKSFFKMLCDFGIKIHEHPFPDHYRYRSEDFIFATKLPIIMTEKDAVKCKAFATEDMWMLQVEARIHPVMEKIIVNLICGAIEENSYEYNKSA